MSIAMLSPTESQVFDALWGFVDTIFASTFSSNIYKGFQNITATPLNSYIILSPGIAIRQDQLVTTYDPTNAVVNNTRGTTYAYQVDCYGPNGPDYSNTVAITWRSMWACDYFAGVLSTPTTNAPLPITPLYADEPQQLNIVNAESQYEQRFMTRLYMQINQVVVLPQDFFTTAPPIAIVIADDLPIS